LGTGRTGKDSQACFRFCFIQQFIALCQFVNWSGPPLFPGPQNLYKGRLVGNTQKAAEQQHTDCHKTGSQARLRRSGLKNEKQRRQAGERKSDSNFLSVLHPKHLFLGVFSL